MAKFSVKLRRDKPLKNGELAIYFNLYDGSDYPISTGKSVQEKFWDDKRRLVKSSHPMSGPINRYIETKVMAVNTYIFGREATNAPVKREAVRAIIKGDNPLSIKSYVDRWLEGKRKVCVAETFQRKEGYAKGMLEYWGDSHITDVTEQSIKEYIQHLRSAGNVNPTISKKISEFHGVYKIAIGAREVTGDPFVNIRVGKKTDNVKERLTIEEINKLRGMTFPKDMQLAVDAFLFSYFAHGMRFMDVCLFGVNNIHSGRIKYTMHKTKAKMDIAISEGLGEIISRYSHRSGYLFPILSRQYSMPLIAKLYDGSRLTPEERAHILKEEHRLISDKESKNVIINRNLKMACVMAGIPKWITFHTARHSVGEGIRKITRDSKAVQNFLGHTSLVSTEHYIEPVDITAMDKAAEELYRESRS